jgi:poly-gamma-glutamate synthesis protein (capsule biosynthesis protein)
MRVFIWATLFAIGVWLLGLIIWTGELRQETNSLANSANTFSVAVNQLQDNIRRNAPTSTLIFVGDIMLSRNVGTKMEKLGDWEFPFKKIKKYLSGADFVFGNLEGPISNRGNNQGSIYSFRADPRAVLGLRAAGIDVVSLANNHIWDWGAEALVDTVEVLKEADIVSLGAGVNKKEANSGNIFKVNGTKIGFLAYTDLYPKSLIANEENPGISDWNEDQVLSDIKRLKAESDLLFVSWHTGTEYEQIPNPQQREIYRGLIEKGVDLVIGHHPHVTQPIEEYGGGWIAYSLGNFIFDQPFSKNTMEGMVLEVLVRNGKITKVEAKKVILNQDFQPSLEGI